MSAEVERYLGYISAYEKAFNTWLDRTAKIVKRYRDDGKDYTYGNESARFNVLWANVQTLVPATFSRLPQPDVSRRFRDSDPVGRVASLLLERALEFDVRHYPDFRESMRNSVLDRFLGGRGVSWIRYEPKTSVQEPISAPGFDAEGDPAIVEGAGAAQVTDDQPLEQIDDETAPSDYVHWRDFGHTPARTWEEVSCVWRKVYLDYPTLCERFGEKVAKNIPLDSSPADQAEESPQNSRMKTGQMQRQKQACIYEIWDKTTQKAVWLSKPLGQVIDEKGDPLGLEGFWPCPKPLYGTITSDSLIPVPDFIQYQDQANELDTISDRIDGLIKALKVRGVYNAEFKELQRLFTETGNNDLIPVKSFAALAEKGGLKGAIDLVDLVPIVQALQAAYEARSNVVSQIQEITGISDIMRGDSDAAETATAQGIKARFGSVRLRSTQEDVALYATEILRLKAQVICNKFTDKTILMMASAGQLLPEDQALVPQALMLLRSNVVRNFRIEVDADSLVQIDEDAQKKDRVEFLTMVSQFLQQAVPAAEQTPEMAPLLLEMMKFGVSAFKAGKTLEGMLDATLERMQKQIQAQANQPKPPPLEIQKINAQSQAKMAEKQHDAQVEFAIEQQRNGLEQQKLQLQAQFEAYKAKLEQETAYAEQEAQARQATQEQLLEAHRDQLKRESEERMEQMRMMLEASNKEADRRFQMLIAAMNNQVKLEVAELSAETTLEAAQVSAARAGSEE